MSEPFVGEIRMVGFNFAPNGWLICQGQLLDISQNETLFTLIGTTYGGDGQNTFALPDLQSRVPIHMGTGPGRSNRFIGDRSGAEQVNLTTSQIPAHTHPPAVNTSGSTSVPANNVWAGWTGSQFSDVAPNAQMANALGLEGGSQPHDNMLPFLTINFIISLFGIFPSQ
jgi:microcystin-dependent protein